MKPIKVLLDSTCDLTGELLEQYGLDYVRMGYNVDDVEYVASLTWEDHSPKELYDLMRSGKRVFTVQAGTPQFIATFNKYISEGYDIIYIGCSGKLSGSVRLGAKIAEDIMAEKKDVKIAVIDALNSGMTQGFLGIMASEMAKEGKTLEEIVETVEKQRFFMNQWATVGSLTYLKNAGRVKAAKAFFGNLFGVKPILISDRNGNNVAVAKAKGRQGSLEYLVNACAESVVNPENHYIAITHADCLEDAETVKAMLEAKIKCKGIYIMPVGPILGASCGPDTLMIVNFGKEVTYVGE